MPRALSHRRWGLSNRIKSLVSAMRYDPNAKVIWIPDKDCNCKYEDIFSDNRSIPEEERNYFDKIVDTWQFENHPEDNIPLDFCTNPTLRSWGLHNATDLMYEKIPESFKNVYLPLLKSLPIKDSILEIVNNTFLSKPFKIAVHIRTWIDAPYRQYLYNLANFEKNILEEVDLVGDKSSDLFPFFLTTDDPSLTKYFIQKYPNVIVYEKREGIIDDFINLLLVSKAETIIGSYLSTFTELAWWYGDCKAKMIVV
jgi:hypothetical protein